MLGVKFPGAVVVTMQKAKASKMLA